MLNHQAIKAVLKSSNAKYKANVDKHHLEKVFDERDLIMAYFCKFRYPIGTYNKLLP